MYIEMELIQNSYHTQTHIKNLMYILKIENVAILLCLHVKWYLFDNITIIWKYCQKKKNVAIKLQSYNKIWKITVTSKMYILKRLSIFQIEDFLTCVSTIQTISLTIILLYSLLLKY